MTASPAPLDAPYGAGSGGVGMSGRLATATRLAAGSPDIDERTDTDELTDHDHPYEVIVWDDPVNLMAYVVHVLRKVLGVDEHEARRLMLEVHTDGKSLVASEPRTQAQLYLQKLHAHGLQATMRRGA
jgi:ATP-dependent Clp protease adaptor protein ClpS